MVDIQRDNNTLDITLFSAFNLRSKNIIEQHLSPEITTLNIDLSQCRYVDSEAVIFLYRWQKSGNSLYLQDPPDILFEILETLDLTDTWNPKT